MPSSFHPLLLEQLATLDKAQEMTAELRPFLEKVDAVYKEKEELNVALEKTNKELDQFVYSVSHDLRAPIASLLGLLNLADPEDNMDAVRHYLVLMRNSIERMDRFIYNLISYSQANRLENFSEPVNFKNLIGEIASSLRHLPHAFEIDLIEEYHHHHTFFSDIPKLKIIVTNLLTNAIQYHRPTQEKPFIRVSVTTNEKEAIIVVEDNGEGIVEEHHSRIFDMFFRGNTKSSGNGLGLYITKETCGKMGGKISFVSSPDKGSTFTLVLPNMH